MFTEKLIHGIEKFAPLAPWPINSGSRRKTMRAELTLRALARESNRYLLCRVVATATRKLHRPNTRVQETMNDALERLGGSSPTVVAAAVPEPALVQQRRAA
jgi:hypothetical protein